MELRGRRGVAGGRSLTASALLGVHRGFAWVVVVGNGLVGLWALGAHRVDRLRSRALWFWTAVAEVAIVVQAILGVAVQSTDEIEAPGIHTFYGFIAIVSVAIIYSYRQQVPEHRYLLFGLGGLFLMGLGIRAMVLG